MRHLPTFASQTIGAHKRDTIEGVMSAILGAIIIGAAFGLLGAAGLPAAFLGAFLSVSGLARMVGPRPLDRSLFRPAKALPLAFACPVVRVDAKRAPLRLGNVAKAYNRTMDAYAEAVSKAHSVQDRPVLDAFRKAERAYDILKMERARWCRDWPKVDPRTIRDEIRFAI